MNNRVSVERAAGGIVVRERGGELQVLLIDDAYGKVSFPKGHLEQGETWEAAAIREVQEETGIEARVIGPVGRLEYPIERDGQPVRKQVRLYLMESIDETVEPTPQLEELPGAYFLPLPDAVHRQQEHGYANWNWALTKAEVLWQWHRSHSDTTWRDLPASTEQGKWQSQWAAALPVLDKLIDSVRVELQTVAPEMAGAITDTAGRLNLPMSVDHDSHVLRQAVEHTLLKPEASLVDIENLCREAVLHRFHAVCVNPQYIEWVSQSLDGSDVATCGVVGFPLGAANPSALAAETSQVIAAGADEVDMVIPIGSMREDDIWTVYEHVRSVTEAAAVKPGVLVKVILETYYLTTDQVIKASAAAVSAGAHMVKTSTGFAAGGARLADVATMARVVGHIAPVKAAGGIRSRTDAFTFLHYGATRIGTSSGVAMIRD